MRQLILCCAFLAALSFSVRAQDDMTGSSSDESRSPVRFGIHGNITNMNLGAKNEPGSRLDFNAELSNIYGLGVGGGAHLDLNLSLLSLRLSGDYLTLSPDRNRYEDFLRRYLGALASEVKVTGGRIDVYTASLNAKLILLPLPVIKPYATGGAGLVRLDVTAADVTLRGNRLYNMPAIQGQTQTALNFGAGVDLVLGGLTLFGEARVTWIFTDGETSTQVPLGIIGLTF